MKTPTLKRTPVLLFAGLFTMTAFSFNGTHHSILSSTELGLRSEERASLYNQPGPGRPEIPEDAFNYAIKGFNFLRAAGQLQNDSILSIVDFTASSDRKRLYVIDLKNGEVLYNTYVSHGQNSGLARADEFSNEPDSYKSSLGFYITGDTYKGMHGYSLKLKGIEYGFNDNVEERRIVMHAADYVNEAFIKSRGYIGQSKGCLAISQNIHRALIATIKNGSCIFVYGHDPFYFEHSLLLNAD